MRTILMILVVVVTLTSAVQAENIGRGFGDVAKGYAVYRVSQWVGRQMDRRNDPRPQPMYDGQCADGPRIIVRRSDGKVIPGDLLVSFTETALHNVGFKTLSLTGREFYKDEVDETNSPYYRPETRVAPAQLDGTELYAIVSFDQGRQGKSSGRSHSGGSATDTWWHRVTIKVTDHSGAELAASTKTRTTTTFAIGGNNRNNGWGTVQNGDPDRAVAAACQDAANEIASRISGSGYNQGGYSPATISTGPDYGQ